MQIRNEHFINISFINVLPIWNYWYTYRLDLETGWMGNREIQDIWMKNDFHEIWFDEWIEIIKVSILGTNFTLNRSLYEELAAV
jgi:hypothetical protein